MQNLFAERAIRFRAVGADSRNHCLGALPGAFRLAVPIDPRLQSGFQRFIPGLPRQLFNAGSQMLAALLGGKAHAKRKLRVVFKQGIGEGRPVPAPVLRIRDARRRGAPRLRASGGVGKDHPVAEQLGKQFHIRSFTAPGARPGELQKRLLELAALDCEFIHQAVFRGK